MGIFPLVSASNEYSDPIRGSLCGPNVNTRVRIHEAETQSYAEHDLGKEAQGKLIFVPSRPPRQVSYEGTKKHDHLFDVVASMRRIFLF